MMKGPDHRIAVQTRSDGTRHWINGADIDRLEAEFRSLWFYRIRLGVCYGTLLGIAVEMLWRYGDHASMVAAGGIIAATIALTCTLLETVTSERAKLAKQQLDVVERGRILLDREVELAERGTGTRTPEEELFARVHASIHAATGDGHLPTVVPSLADMAERQRAERDTAEQLEHGNDFVANWHREVAAPAPVPAVHQRVPKRAITLD